MNMQRGQEEGHQRHKNMSSSKHQRTIFTKFHSYLIAAASHFGVPPIAVRRQALLRRLLPLALPALDAGTGGLRTFTGREYEATVDRRQTTFGHAALHLKGVVTVTPIRVNVVNSCSPPKKCD